MRLLRSERKLQKIINDIIKATRDKIRPTISKVRVRLAISTTSCGKEKKILEIKDVFALYDTTLPPNWVLYPLTF